MNLIYTSKLAPFPASPAQRFVDEQGHDITNEVTAYDSEMFEALAAQHARIEIIEQLAPIIEAIRNMIESGNVTVIRGHVSDDEPEYQFDPAFVPGNATRH